MQNPYQRIRQVTRGSPRDFFRSRAPISDRNDEALTALDEWPPFPARPEAGEMALALGAPPPCLQIGDPWTPWVSVAKDYRDRASSSNFRLSSPLW